MAKKKDDAAVSSSDAKGLAEEIISAAPELKDVVDLVLDLIEAPAHIPGTLQFSEDEIRLQNLAVDLAAVPYPDTVRPQLIDLFERARVSLAA